VPGAERGAYLLRVQNSTSKAADTQIQFPGSQLEGAYIGSVMGDKSGSVEWSAHQVNLSMAPFDVKTVVVHVGSASDTSKEQK
jgi:hypothetical protein